MVYGWWEGSLTLVKLSLHALHLRLVPTDAVQTLRTQTWGGDVKVSEWQRKEYKKNERR